MRFTLIIACLILSATSAIAGGNRYKLILDEGFTLENPPNGNVYDTIVEPDGSIILGGYFSPATQRWNPPFPNSNESEYRL